MIQENEIRLTVTVRRGSCDSYLARCNGKTCSCTSSAETAVERAAAKALPRVLELAGEDPAGWMTTEPVQIESHRYAVDCVRRPA
jgi:hypothetical protein